MPSPTLPLKDLSSVLPTADSLLFGSLSMEDLDRYQKFIQIKQGLRAEEQYNEKIEEAKRARQAGIENTKMQMEMALNKQTMCGHLKENGRTHLAGQKDHAGVVHFICQNCQKEFIGDKTPHHLRPNMEVVGGPNN